METQFYTNLATQHDGLPFSSIKNKGRLYKTSAVRREGFVQCGHFANKEGGKFFKCGHLNFLLQTTSIVFENHSVSARTRWGYKVV